MEDAHAAILSLDEGIESSNTFFAVYDGHGGMFSNQRLFKKTVLWFSSRGQVVQWPNLRARTFTSGLLWRKRIANIGTKKP